MIICNVSFVLLHYGGDVIASTISHNWLRIISLKCNITNCSHDFENCLENIEILTVKTK